MYQYATSCARNQGKAAAANIPAQAGALSPETQATAHALQAATAAAAAAAAAPPAAAAAADDDDTEDWDDEPCVLPADLLAVSRRAVKRIRRSLEIADVKFGLGTYST